jgi:hypothetical protein
MTPICCWVGRLAGATAGGGGGSVGGGAATTAGGVASGAASGGAAARPVTTAWQAGERSAALALRQSTSSGLPGAMNEQWAATSLSVHTLLTAASSCCGDCPSVGAADGDSAVTAVSGCAFAFSAPASCGSDFGASDLAVTAFTAAPQAADSCGAWLARHSRASRPPGWTPMQCEMKSLRQALRIAWTSAGDGCAPAGCPAAKAPSRASNATRRPMRTDINVSPYFGRPKSTSPGNMSTKRVDQ